MKITIQAWWTGYHSVYTWMLQKISTDYLSIPFLIRIKPLSCNTMTNFRLNTGTSYTLQFWSFHESKLQSIFISNLTWKNELELFDMAGRSILVFYILYSDLLWKLYHQWNKLWCKFIVMSIGILITSWFWTTFI